MDILSRVDSANSTFTGGDAVTTTDDVIGTLKEIRELLWADRVRWVSAADRALMSIDQCTDLNERRVLYLFGGMGSLNDIWICRANGDLVDDEQQANASSGSSCIALVGSGQRTLVTPCVA